MAAQDAELKLRVSLDLAFFRQQLAGLGTAAAGYSVPINVKFDRRSVQNELNALGRNVSQRKYRLEVATNISSEIENAAKLAKALDGLSKSRKSAQVSINQQLGLGTLLQGPASGGLDSKSVGRLYRAAARAGILEYSKEVARTKASAVAALEAVGSDSVKGLLNGLTSEDKKLKEAAEYLGEALIGTVKKVLGIASPSREFKKIGQNVGEGFQQGMLSSMDKAFDAAEGLMRTRMKVLDTLARGIFRMAGIDPEALRQQEAVRRLPPAINFPASIPSRRIPIGPSSTGRALTGVSQAALPGQSITAAKYLPSDLGVELKNILRNAAYAFVDSLKDRVRRVSVREINQAQLMSSQVAGLLSPAVGRESARYGGPGDARGRRMAAAHARSAARRASVMAETPQGFSLGAGGSGPGGPFRQYAQPPRGGAIVPYQAPTPRESGIRGPGGFRGISQQLSRFKQGMAPLQQARLPLTGAVSELGGEFGNAIKQVLLFGTAYKALAFFIDMPAQAFEAARSLASFQNQLMAVTGGGPAFEQSLRFISDTVQRFNVPLESARTGFARLYASMEPAGIDQSTIQGLFTGISQAAATLSMTPDQVDRVTYAFSQMASKGKIMSEEVTGQLGDVIPGALSLMADAAGMSMADFKKAMEDGQLSGDALGQVLNNVGIVLGERFGKGAEGAAKTLQGSINNINNSLKSMYEALSPIVNQFAQAFGPKIQSIIKDATDVFSILSGNFSDVEDAAKALSPQGMALYKVIKQLTPAVTNAASSVASLGQLFLQLSPVIVNVVTAALQFLNTDLGRGLIIFAGAVGTLTTAFSVLKATGLAPTIAALYNFIAAMVAAQAKQFALWIVGLTKGMLGLRNAFRAARISAVLFTGALTAIATAGISLIIAGIANAMLDVGDNAKKAAGDVAQLKHQLDGIAGAGDVLAAQSNLEMKQGVEQAAELIVAVRQKELAEAQKRKSYADPATLLQVNAAKTNLETANTAFGKAIEERVLAEKTVNNAKRVAGERATALLPSRQEVTLGEDEDKKTGKTAASKLKEYDRDLASHYTNIARTESEGIKQRMDLTSREKEIALAVIDFTLKDKLARAQYQRDIRKTNELVVADRQQYLADKKSQLDAELKLAEEEFGTVVLSPFTERAEGEVEAQNELKESIKALKSEREELSAVEKAEIYIQTSLKGITEEYKDQLTPFIQRLRDAATETDRLSKVEKALAEQRKYNKGPLADAQGKARLAGMLDPRQELREGIRQRLGESATPERIEELAKLEETTMRMEDIKGAIQGVKDEFAGLFSTIITGSGSAQESLAQAFANIGKSFADMAGEMIAQWLYMQAIGLISQMFPGGGSTGLSDLNAPANINNPLGVISNANGNVLLGGFQAFANGGVVTGPTLGLVGEGRYNEAVVPLPDGRSIPVEMGGAAGPQINSSIVVNVSSDGQSSSKGGGSDSAGLGRKLEGAVKQVIVDELRPGGLLGRR